MLSLSDSQRERLKEAIAKTKDSQIKMRMSIFLLIDKGFGVCSTANRLGISHGLIRYWLYKGNPNDLSSFESRNKKWVEKDHTRKLTNKQKKLLQGALQQTKDYTLKTRYSIFLEADKGLSLKEIATELGIEKGEVVYWLKKGDPDNLDSFIGKRKNKGNQ